MAASQASAVPGLIQIPKGLLRVHRTALLFVSLAPLAALVLIAFSSWGHGFDGTDAAIFAGMYAFTGLGVTVGFHRLLAHRTFEAPAPVRAVLAVAGSMAIEMGVISWVATHRRHHAFSDRPGDPHSPHLDAARGWRGIAKGLWHAHVGWLFGPERSAPERWAPDLLRDPTLRRIDALFPLWVALSFLAPAIAGLVATRSLAGAASALLWGGFARVFLLHQVTFSINSICHFFGRRPYETRERSTNVWPLSLLSFGESWHNNHHAFQASAFLGLRAWQLDPGAWLIRALSATGLARGIKRPSAERIAGMRGAPTESTADQPGPESIDRTESMVSASAGSLSGR